MKTMLILAMVISSQMGLAGELPECRNGKYLVGFRDAHGLFVTLDVLRPELLKKDENAKRAFEELLYAIKYNSNVILECDSTIEPF